MKRIAVPAVLAALCLLALAPSAQALRISTTLDQIAQTADVVLVGQVASLEPTYNAEGFIVTDATVSIERVLKGADTLADERSIVLRFAGGQIGDVGVQVTGVPQLTPGGRYVLMVYSDGRTRMSPVVGVDQGLFRVVTEPKTGRELVLTSSGRFVERIEDGDIVAGSVATLNPDGRYIARERAAGRLLDEPAAAPTPKAEGENGARVIAVRPLKLPVTDAGKVMTLRSFVAQIEALLAGPSK